jgi:hypothetical protein
MAVLAVLVLVAIAAIARPVLHAAEVILGVALIAGASLLGLGAIGGIAFLVLRVHRRQARKLQAMSQHARVVQRSSQAVSAPQRLAIEAPRPSLAEVKALAAEQGYDVIRRPADD